MRTFKTMLLLVSTVVLLGGQALSQLLVEDFSYTSGMNLNGLGGWSAHSAAGTNPPQITVGGLTYPGYASSGIGNAVSFTTNGEDNNKPYATFPNGTASGSLYYALMVRIDSAGATGDYFFHLLKNSSTFSARLFVKRASNGNLRFGIGKSSTIANINFSDSIYTTGTTYLLAVKYTVIAGATNDTVALWINPTPGGTEPAPTVLESTADRGATDVDTLYAVALRQGAAANAPIGRVDGIRVGTTWSDVVAGGGGTVKTINNTLPTGGDNYASFTDAINALNSGGVPTGGITYNVSAGQTFTENPPEITATGTAADQITFRKSGGGANPRIVPSIAGTVASSTTIGSHGDGILIINGGDYMTFDGIDLQTDSTFTGTGMMEYGYYLKKASGDNACKNITIKNCTITLNKAAIYSFGVFVSNISGTTSVTVTSTGGRSENIKIQNTTITNSYGGVQARGFAAAAPYDFYDTNVELDGCTINNYGGGATTVYGVYGIYQDSLTVKNSTISGGDGTTTTHYGVFVSTGINSEITIDNNTISMTNSSTTSQMTAISLQTGATTGTSNTHNVRNNVIAMNRPSVTSGVTYVLYFTSNYPLVLNIENNRIRNISHASTGAFYGIYQISNPVNLYIRNNSIGNISTNSSALYGINLSSVTTAQNTEISGNRIDSLTTGGTSGAVAAINASSGMAYRIFKNNIYNLSSTGTTGTAFGITKLGTSDSTFIYNNFISDLRASSSTSSNAVAGINVTATATTSFVYAFYNTIYLKDSSSSATTFGTSGIFVNTGPTVDLRNNVVVNLSTPGPTGGGTVAYRRSSATLTSYAAESNNNDFYVNPAAGVRRYFYGEGTGAGVTNADSTLQAYKGRVAPRDAASIGENPPFINATTTPYNLHINTATPTQLESGGTPITSPIAITQDYDGNTRNATTPDIGADEFAGVGADLTPPSIIYTPVGNTTAGTVRTLTAAISDPSGVPTTGIGRPVLYWKRNSGGTYTGATGTFVSGNDYTFSFGAGTVAGDTVYYFIAAQDNVNNVGVFPSIGAGGFTPNPPAASTPPSNPSSYRVLPVLAAGTYTVGTTSGTYATLNAAFNAINNAVVAGNVTLSILNEGTTEPGTAQLNEVNYGTGGPFTITIKPAANAQPRIQGAAPRSGLIKIRGADYVTIDGSNTAGGSTRNLTLANTATGFSTTVVWIGSLGAGAGATNITIKNCNLIATGNDSNNTSSIYAASADTITASATGADNNNLVIENNTMQRGRFGVYVRGASPGILSGLVIRNNSIGSDSSGYEVSYRGLDIGNADSALVTGNRIFNMLQPTALTIAGIHLDLNVSNATISKNIIAKVTNTNTGSFGSIGIEIGSATGSTNVSIVNNMISELICNGGGTSTASNPYGIRIVGGTNHKIYYNSVSLPGAFLGTGTTNLSAAFIVTASTATGMDVRNNIFSNSMTGATGCKSYSIYAVSASTVFGTIDRNDYYVAGANGILGRQGTTDVTDLAGWRAFTTQDSNSVSGNPFFLNAASNLHIDSTQTTLVVSNAGTPIAGITTDIDGQTRSASTPDIGADEFGVFVPPPPAEAWTDHLTSTMRVTVTNEGNIGSLNAFVGTGPGNGFMFNPVNSTGQRLFEGSIMLGLDSVRVSDAARNNANPEVFDADFKFLTNLDSSLTAGPLRVIRTAYTDSLAETPFGLRVDQTTLSYDSTGLSSILLVQLDLTNTTATPWTSLLAGGFFDWDVNPANAQDRGSVIVDSTNVIPGVNNNNPFRFDMLEMHQAASPNSWVGIVPLNENRFRGRRIAISSSEVYPPHMTNGDKWRYMSENRATNPNGDGGSGVDHAQVFGLGPYPVAAAATKRVGFAVVAGTSLQEFVNAARAAQRAWVLRFGNSINVVTTGVQDPYAGIPQTFDLAQNYPNPFNPTTTIKYALPEAANVNLSVYNILGQRVATLTNEVHAAGYYEARWTGRNDAGQQVATGVYFYRIEATATGSSAKFTSLKKMLLLK